MREHTPKILVTNDDGIHAAGLRALVDAMREIGSVIVVAPDSPQSGMGHAITIAKPLRLEKVNVFDGIDAYQCSGTPVDCVKLAKDIVLKAKPDLCVSGINHGSNSSINVIYSGTMSAAMEASIEGINAVGFSLLDYHDGLDLEPAKGVATRIATHMLEAGIPQGTLLNVNIPALDAQSLKGIKICRQAIAKWEEEYDSRTDPNGKPYYWLTGKFVNKDHGEDTDEWALKQGYVSVVPTQYDMTAHHAISHINSQWQLD